MRRMRWALMVWPGLPLLWTSGSWAALAWTLGAAGLLNLALLGTLVWRELFAEPVRTALWGLVGVVWIGSAAAAGALRAWGGGRRRDALGEQRFREALEHYLKGSWFETERVLGSLLRTNSRDLEARLMLATLLRHAGRADEAAFQLDLLAKFEGAQRWQWEIDRERQLLLRARAERPAARAESERLGLPGRGETDGAAERRAA